MFKERKFFLYTGIFLITLSTLIYEILLTRILSVLMYYNFVSAIIALALFGLSISSIYVYIHQDKYLKEDIPEKIAYFSKLLVFSVFTIFLVLIFFRLFPEIIERFLSIFQPVDIDNEYLLGNKLIDNIAIFITTSVFFILITIPFFLNGMCITLIMLNFSQDISFIYFSDLIGAGLGCILVIPIINLFGAPSAIIITAILILLATISFLWWQNEPKTFSNLLLILAIFLSIALLNSYFKFIDIDFIHGKFSDDIIYSDWDALSRVAVYPLEDELSNESESKKADEEEKIPQRMGIAINETGYTAMVEFKNDFSQLDYLSKMINFLVFHLQQDQEVLLIGPGGGEDILAGLYFKNKKITAVEINGLLVDIVNKKFAPFSGSPYSLPKVETYIDNARSFIKTTDQKYDIISASLVYEWFHPSGGAFALSESHLYTIEAFEDYFSHLNSDGILSISRFSFESRTLRLVALALEAFKKLKIENPENHIFIADDNFGFATFLFKKSPFTQNELSILNTECNRNNFTITYMPDSSNQNIKKDSIYFNLIYAKNYQEFYEKYPYDISPPYDDKPFLNYMVKPKDLFLSFHKIPIKEVNEKTIYLLRWILILSLILIIVLIIYPQKFINILDFNRQKSLYPIFYFMFIGFGFMMIEITAIRKFSLLLGNPIYSLAIVLFSILSFSGLGSFFTKKITDNNIKKWIFIAIGCICTISSVLIFLPYISEPLFRFPLWIRIISCSIILFPLGIFLGMPLPIGIKHIEKKLIPWVFSINGAASVAGSISAFILAMNFGFNLVLILAIVSYIASLILYFRIAR